MGGGDERGAGLSQPAMSPVMTGRVRVFAAPYDYN